MDRTDFTVDWIEMVRLSDIFCSNSEGNSLWVDRRSVGRWSMGRRTRARSVEAHHLACLALWSSVFFELGVSVRSFERV